jgi:hypothetical protein
MLVLVRFMVELEVLSVKQKVEWKIVGKEEEEEDLKKLVNRKC